MIFQIYQWVKNIAFYLILITAVMNVLPDNNYKKYVKLFTGIVLVLLVLSPLTKLLDLDRVMDVAFMEEGFEQELGGITGQADAFMNVQKSRLFDGYAQEAAQKIEEIVEQDGLYPVNVEVILEQDEHSEEYGSIREINIVAAYSKPVPAQIHVDSVEIGDGEKKMAPKSPEEINIKNDLERFYNISPGNINISIQR